MLAWAVQSLCFVPCLGTVVAAWSRPRATIVMEERTMSGFRSHDGQHSDRMPIKRSLDEKKRLLVQLKEQQAALKPWTAEAVKTSMAKRIADLEAELRSAKR